MTTGPTVSLAAQVEAAFLHALFTTEEVAAGADAEHVDVEGITLRVGFHPKRLEASRGEVLGLCDAIVRPEFWAEGPGRGYSFLCLPFDVTGAQWGEHCNAEQLFLLAAGLGLAAFLVPRAYWELLPGSMPYLVFRRAPLAASGSGQ